MNGFYFIVILSIALTISFYPSYDNGYTEIITKYENLVEDYANLNLTDPFNIKNQEKCLKIFNDIAAEQQSGDQFYFLLKYPFTNNSGLQKLGKERAINNLYQALTKKFTEYCKSDMEDEMNNKIQFFIGSIPTEANDTTKCEMIAEWINQNFTSIFMTNGSCLPDETRELYFYKNSNPQKGEPEYNHKYFPGQLLGFDKRGRIRARNGNGLSINPYWCLFMNTGACGEISIIFDEISKRSGLDTRIIKKKRMNESDPDHQWNEVHIDGEWKFVDITIYERKDPKLQWFGDPVNYYNPDIGEVILAYAYRNRDTGSERIENRSLAYHPSQSKFVPNCVDTVTNWIGLTNIY